jgi:putative iron-only hydrogenase system regulator
MESRVAIIGIIIEDKNSIQKLNDLLHEYGKYIIGRMGIPYGKRDINIISIVIDAPQDEINTLSGKIGKLNGITSKVAYSKSFKD